MWIKFLWHFFYRYKTISTRGNKTFNAFIYKAFATEGAGGLQKADIIEIFPITIKKMKDMFYHIKGRRCIACQVCRPHKWNLYRSFFGGFCDIRAIGAKNGFVDEVRLQGRLVSILY